GLRAGDDPWALPKTRNAMNAAAVGDCDDDGLPDAVVADYAGPLRLWHNEGGLRFRDATAGSGLAVDRADATNAVLGDLDHDGRLDAVVTTGLRAAVATFARDAPAAASARVRVFRGLGGCRFADVTDAWGFDAVALRNPAVLLGADLADLDGDGLLDVLPRVLLDPGQRPAVFLSAPGPRWRRAAGVLPEALAGSHWSTLVTSARGAASPSMLVLFDAAEGPPSRFLAGGAAWPPAFVEENVLPELFAPMPMPYDLMGAATGDYDGDGRLDVFVTDVGAQHLLRQRADGGFDDVADRAGTRAASPPDGGRTVAFTVAFTDYDRDAWPDLAIATSIDGGNRPPPYAFLFHNRGDGTFEDASALLLQTQPYATEGLAAADLDRDGREDLWFGGGSLPPRVLRNTGTTGNGLAVRLRGTVSNAEGVGARVTLRVGSRSLVREVGASGATFGSGERRLMFGLGAAAQADDAVVEWPSGLVQHAGPLAAGREHAIEEPAFVALSASRVAAGGSLTVTLRPALLGDGAAPEVTALPEGAAVPLRCADGVCTGEVIAAGPGLHALSLRAAGAVLPAHPQFVVD
ncbi:MAG: ASPIC/UnbV domain protein, partial [Myxococcaceae bacterium]|nr:ASPIC/UnbV domain protein [Myxococcaceae bacterium]